MATEDKRERGFSFSSEHRVQRWYGTEILDHKPESIRMDRLKSGRAPLLKDHDMRKQIGVITAPSVGRDKIGRATARFSRSQAGEESLRDVDDQIATNTSVGYFIHRMVLEEQNDKEGDTYRMTDWEPFEVSVVSVPADPTVGLGRSLDPGDPPDPAAASAAATPEARSTRASSFSPPGDSATTTEESMSTQTNATAGNGTEGAAAAASNQTQTQTRAHEGVKQVGESGPDREQGRIDAINNMCTACSINDDAMKQRWITSGMSMKDVSDDIMQIVAKRGQQNQKAVTSNLGLTDRETQRFSVIRAIRAAADNDWREAGFEAECSREISKKMNRIPDAKKFYVPYEVQARHIPAEALMSGQRALAGATRADVVATAGAGGYLVQTTNQGFIELLRNRSVIYRMGATQLPGLTGNVNIPRQSAAATAFWLSSETSQITETEQTFGQIALTPKTAGAYTEISRLLLMQSSPGVEGIVNADLAAVTGLAVDKAGISGTGTSGQPTGILNINGVASISGANITSIAYPGLVQYQVALASANVNPDRAGYVTTPAIAGFMMGKSRFANTDTPIWDGNLWNGQVAGFPGMSSNQLPSQTTIFGDWSSLVVAEWGVLEIEVNPYANFQAGIIGIRAMVTVDIAARYPQAFAQSSTTTS